MTAAWMLTFWLLAVGWFCCCEASGQPCDYCSGGSGPASVAVTFAGFTDDQCLCEFHLHAATVVPAVGNCEYIRYGPGIQARIDYIGSNLGWIVDLEFGCGFGIKTLYVTYQWDSGSPDPFDCTSPRDLVYVSHYHTGSGTYPCDITSLSGTTCRVN